MAAVIECVWDRGYGYGFGITGRAVAGVGVFVAGMDAVVAVEGVEVGEDD